MAAFLLVFPAVRMCIPRQNPPRDSAEIQPWSNAPTGPRHALESWPVECPYYFQGPDRCCASASIRWVSHSLLLAPRSARAAPAPPPPTLKFRKPPHASIPWSYLPRTLLVPQRFYRL